MIKKIRNKPENIRKRYALGATIFVTAIIVGVWVMALDFKPVTDDSTESDNPVVQTASPFRQILSSVKKAFSNPPKLKGSLKNPSSTDVQGENNTVDNSDVVIIDSSEEPKISDANAVITGENVVE